MLDLRTSMRLSLLGAATTALAAAACSIDQGAEETAGVASAQTSYSVDLDILVQCETPEEAIAANCVVRATTPESDRRTIDISSALSQGTDRYIALYSIAQHGTDAAPGVTEAVTEMSPLDPSASDSVHFATEQSLTRTAPEGLLTWRAGWSHSTVSPGSASSTTLSFLRSVTRLQRKSGDVQIETRDVDPARSHRVADGSTVTAQTSTSSNRDLVARSDEVFRAIVDPEYPLDPLDHVTTSVPTVRTAFTSNESDQLLNLPEAAYRSVAPSAAFPTHLATNFWPKLDDQMMESMFAAEGVSMTWKVETVGVALQADEVIRLFTHDLLAEMAEHLPQ